MSTGAADASQSAGEGDVLRESLMARRRALLGENRELEKLLGIPRKTVYVPGSLHPTDLEMLRRHFQIVQAERPVRP